MWVTISLLRIYLIFYLYSLASRVRRMIVRLIKITLDGMDGVYASYNPPPRLHMVYRPNWCLIGGAAGFDLSSVPR